MWTLRILKEPIKKHQTIGGFLFRVFNVICRFLCGHYQWKKTGDTLGSKLDVWQCKKCRKKIYREKFDPPISYVENGR